MVWPVSSGNWKALLYEGTRISFLGDFMRFSSDLSTLDFHSIDLARKRK